MTEVQINYLSTFFNVNGKIDIRAISKQLITDGSCIIGGERIYWYGETSGYIKSENHHGQFNCFTYTFDLEGFLASNLFIQEKGRKLKKLQDEMGKTLEEFNEIQLL
jgi:hypothetical protein